MNKCTRTLMTVLLASALSSVAACGDDDEADMVGDNGGNGGGDNDGDNDGNNDGNGGNNGGNNGNNGGNNGVLPPLAPECAKHPNVSESPDGTLCVISGSQTDPIKTDLTIGPVEGKEGYAFEAGVFVGEDVGGAATPAAGKATATLKILPGTKMLGLSPLAFVLINRGSKIDAVGTKDNPIVFTSLPEDGKYAPGQWGGLIINGRAPHNQGIDIQGEAGTGLYAGPDPMDNSGTLKYVRVEFGGGKQNAENELNGVAFQGVGKGTVVDYVHVHANDDDGIEWYGGTVDAKHLVVTASGDDGLDWVGGWNGNVQFAIAQQWSNVSSSDPNGIEADNNSSNPGATPRSNPTLSNVTIIGSSTVAASRGMHLRRGTGAKLHSFVTFGFSEGCIHVDGTDSADLVGTELTMTTSRIACTKSYGFNGMGEEAAKSLLEGGTGNMVVADAATLLEEPFSRTAPNFAPKAASGLLTGGTVAPGAFFSAAAHVGAVGEEDWTDGNWMKVTDF